MWRSTVWLIVVMSVACPALADSDGSFCSHGDYVAYELRPFATTSVKAHVLRIARFDAQHGIRIVGEAALSDFQVHQLSCLVDRVEISGWGNGFESYSVGLSGAGAPPILEHRSDPSARFDPTTDPPEPRRFWSEPVGDRLLGSSGQQTFVLVISGTDTRTKGAIEHHRVATLTEKSETGIIRRQLQLYESHRLETIDSTQAHVRD